MYKSYNVQSSLNFDDYYDIGIEIFKNNKKTTENVLDKYTLMTNKDILDAKSIQQDWFPQIDAQIFLSHSHADEDKIISFAGWLYEKFHLKAFIDSCVWGYADELLLQLDKEYCYQERTNTYNYQKRNYTTSHVHTMLSMALYNMIDKVETVFFINTNNSIDYSLNATLQEQLNNTSYTKSPWIYSELVMINKIRKTLRRRYRTDGIELEERNRRIFNEAQTIDIAYNVKNELSGLTTITDENLELWLKSYKQTNNQTRMLGTPVHPLDLLYMQHEEGILIG